MDLVTEQMLERRARILQGTRELIGDRGYAGLTMRDLAAHCRVSVPTLYNQFGSKDELLAAAVGSHFSGLLAGARSQKEQGYARLLAVVRLCAEEMARLPRYHRALLQAFMGGREMSLQASLAAELAAELERGLSEMRERRQLADWVSTRVLAERITAACIGASVAWMVGEFDDVKLRAANVHAAATMVLGSAKGVAKTALELAARDAQDALEAKAAPAAAASA